MKKRILSLIRAVLLGILPVILREATPARPRVFP